MDWSSFILPVFIIVFGLLEYRRRERVHALRLADLERGVEPSFARPKTTRFKVISSGVVAFLLLLMTIGLFAMGIITRKPMGPLGWVGGFFGCIFLLVATMFLFTLRRYRRKQ
jgi:sterol desaturase/sphingolipid hydroxylase (fatty acid hydroxylase superfamily)